MDDCIFCKIISEDIPSPKVYEDEHIFAFLDMNPVNEGHTLVIPKQHYTDIFDMPEDTVSNVFSGAKKIASAVMAGVKADGINIGMNNRPASGQVIFHAHVHIIPRFEGDGLKHWAGKERGHETQKAVADAIAAAVQ